MAAVPAKVQSWMAATSIEARKLVSLIEVNEVLVKIADCTLLNVSQTQKSALYSFQVEASKLNSVRDNLVKVLRLRQDRSGLTRILSGPSRQMKLSVVEPMKQGGDYRLTLAVIFR